MLFQYVPLPLYPLTLLYHSFSMISNLSYNGHGVPKPTANGELWFFNENYSQYIPLSLNEIRKNIVGTPTFYVIDCSNAGIVMPYLTKPLSDIGTSSK